MHTWRRENGPRNGGAQKTVADEAYEGRFMASSTARDDGDVFVTIVAGVNDCCSSRLAFIQACLIAGNVATFDILIIAKRWVGQDQSTEGILDES
jgi:hypothetical protein